MQITGEEYWHGAATAWLEHVGDEEHGATPQL
jgi:hypothetical protein